MKHLHSGEARDACHDDGTVVLVTSGRIPVFDGVLPAPVQGPGGQQPPSAEQFVQDRVGWNERPPGPVTPPDVVGGAVARRGRLPRIDRTAVGV
ncbi:MULTISPECIES: hypothetical protein [Thermocrispum]|jgi:hypothetical protein|uniref:Uncharacterized protein n=1 Tax=Thermocrispum agreste TaxID=37925 RepID=A0A2W4JI10_9PSEU|nr:MULTISPECIES: hypothetical protein [Thermocrispum]PZM98091.1 MAG: hypothetical protein DIU77_08410 [Thermocrispum agreste]